jgi:DNA-binding transcriptional ArsR family regulator
MLIGGRTVTTEQSIDLEKLRERAGEASALLRAMSNPTRLHILCQLVDGEKSVGELEVMTDLTQSAVSQHLGRLRREGLIRSRRDAQMIFYSLTSPEVTAILETLYELYCEGHGVPGVGLTQLATPSRVTSVGGDSV